MELIEALRTTGAVREFTGEPVGDDVVARVLDTARFAPSGGNRQGWRVVLVKDPAARRELRDVYLNGWYPYLAQVSAGLVPWSPAADREAEERAIGGAAAIATAAAAGGGGFAENLETVPVLLALTVDVRVLAAVDRDLPRYTFAGGASVYPFAWSILLAAREEGLAGVITTMAVRGEADVLTLLGMPPGFALAGLIALGHPVAAPTRLRRRPVAEFATVDSFDGPALEA